MGYHPKPTLTLILGTKIFGVVHLRIKQIDQLGIKIFRGQDYH